MAAWPNDSYHKQSEAFTKKLKKLMNQNPSLPVVLSLPSGAYEGRLTCDVAYVYDSLNEEFREKIIAIQCEADNQGIKDEDTELPF